MCSCFIYSASFLPSDCADILSNSGLNINGLYTIYIGSGKSPLTVYCDMTTTSGGWTVRVIGLLFVQYSLRPKLNKRCAIAIVFVSTHKPFLKAHVITLCFSCSFKNYCKQIKKSEILRTQTVSIFHQIHAKRYYP